MKKIHIALFTIILAFFPALLSAQPNIDGDDWTGYFETTGFNNRQSITASINQSGNSVTIVTSKSGLGSRLVGSINSNGDMLVFDQYDGEDWTTHFGPATLAQVAIYDFICPTCSQLNSIVLTRTLPPPNISEIVPILFPLLLDN